MMKQEISEPSTAPVITIDGVSGSGKGTIAQLVAKALNWHYLDSGALYRILALASIQAGTPFDDPVALVELLQSLDLSFECTANSLKIRINGDEVTHQLRTEEVGGVASKVGSLQAVRTALLDKQRSFRRLPGLVTDGRDMGSVIFKDAAIKFYMDASPEERARRRQLQLQEMGKSVTFAALLAELKERDTRDKTREVAPLVIPEGAIYVLTDQLTIDQVFNKVMESIVAAGLHVWGNTAT